MENNKSNQKASGGFMYRLIIIVCIIALIIAAGAGFVFIREIKNSGKSDSPSGTALKSDEDMTTETPEGTSEDTSGNAADNLYFARADPFCFHLPNIAKTSASAKLQAPYLDISQYRAWADPASHIHNAPAIRYIRPIGLREAWTSGDICWKWYICRQLYFCPKDSHFSTPSCNLYICQENKNLKRHKY